MTLLEDFNDAASPDEDFGKRVAAALLNKAKEELLTGGLSGALPLTLTQAEILRIRLLRAVGFLQQGPSSASGPLVIILRLLINAGVDEAATDATITNTIDANFDAILKMFLQETD